MKAEFSRPPLELDPPEGHPELSCNPPVQLLLFCARSGGMGRRFMVPKFRHLNYKPSFSLRLMEPPET